MAGTSKSCSKTQMRIVFKGQLISKRLLEKIVWTKIATKKFDNFCPGGQIKKIKTLYYIALDTP